MLMLKVLLWNRKAKQRVLCKRREYTKRARSINRQKYLVVSVKHGCQINFSFNPERHQI